MKKIGLELYYLLALIPAILPNHVSNFGLLLGLPWTLNYVLIWLLVLILSGFSAFLCYKTLKGRARFLTPVLALVIPLGFYFAAKPIYDGDFSKTGTSVNYGTENIILQDILRYKSDFKGVVCVASPYCPFCIEAVRDKMRMLDQRKKTDVAVYLPSGEANLIQHFRDKTAAHSIPIVPNSNPEVGFDIDENVIPVFLYIQNQRIVHVWRNDQLGYPALDWIENGLK